MMWWLLTACVTCPVGFDRTDGRCEPRTPDTPIEPAPLDANSFLDRYERDACKALEDCVCDEFGPSVDDCELDDCRSDFDDIVGCVFDQGEAEACLAGAWECDVDGDVVYAIAPDECSRVFDCTPQPTDTGDTGTR
jgi:hypothetical protein